MDTLEQLSVTVDTVAKRLPVSMKANTGHVSNRLATVSQRAKQLSIGGSKATLSLPLSANKSSASTDIGIEQLYVSPRVSALACLWTAC